MQNDLISRRALLAREAVVKDQDGAELAVVLAADVQAAPAVDAQRITRCKDCKKYTSGGWCAVSIERMEPDGWCSRSERKGGGDHG